MAIFKGVITHILPIFEKDNLATIEFRLENKDEQYPTSAIFKKFAKDDNGNANLLIDDYEKNVQEWERAGGIGILHKNGPNTIRELKRLGFK